MYRTKMVHSYDRARQHVPSGSVLDRWCQAQEYWDEETESRDILLMDHASSSVLQEYTTLSPHLLKRRPGSRDMNLNS